ncbi:MAG: peptidylprolyl isomerase [Elusimicrobiota bacterium]
MKNYRDEGRGIRNEKLEKLIMVFTFALCFTLYTVHCLHAAVVNKVVAKINSDIILQSEYDEVINPIISQIKKAYSDTVSQDDIDKKIVQVKKELLDQMINQKLLLQEAKKKDIKVTKREIDEGIKMVKDRFKKKDEKGLTPSESEAEFNAELKKQNLTISKFNDKIKEDITINKLIENEVLRKVESLPESELKDYYEKNKDKIDDPEKVSVRHILIRFEKQSSIKDESAALKKIQEVQKLLKNGEDFSKLADQYSEDPGSNKNGGDLGFITREMMLKDFENVAFKTPVGEISSIFKTEFGYHILKIDAKQAKQKRSFEKVKIDLEKFLLAEKRQDEYEKYIKNLREKSSVSIEIK